MATKINDNSSQLANIDNKEPQQASMGKKLVRMGSWAVKDESELQPAFFSFRNIHCTLKVKGKDKVLLHGVSGYCKPGQALAIMGPSGAGKSTLLDILSYRKTTGVFTQDVMLNGEKLTQRTFQKHNGYVTSDDLLPPEMTVREALQFCAALRLPPNWTHEQRQDRIEDVISVMRLNYVANNRIGSALVRGLSTGERKRVNVAVELLPVAAVVFLDEPTTGLDSNTGREIIENVLEVVKMRKLSCVATIHQPSYTILRQFESLLLLANGSQCYFGRTADAISYFENYLGIPISGNPAETYAAAQAANPERIIAAWEASQEKQILAKAVEATHTGSGSVKNYKPIGTDEKPTFWDNIGFHQQANGWTQFIQLFKRQMTIYVRNPLMSTSRFFAAIAVAIFFGCAYLNLPRTTSGAVARVAELFALKLMTPGFGSAAIAYWLEKRKSYYHEESAGYYHRFYYIVTNFIVEWLFLSAMMAICLCITLPLSGWINQFLGNHILHFVAQAFSVTGFNMVCTYMAASIPYANAAFNLQYYWGLMIAGQYITDRYLFGRPGGFLFKYFFCWTSWARMAFIPSIRMEFEGQPLGCDSTVQLQFSTNDIVVGGMGDAALELTKQAIRNTTIIDSINALEKSTFGGGWYRSTPALNSTIKSLYSLAGNAYDAFTVSAVVANITAPTAGSNATVPASVSTYLTGKLTGAVQRLSSLAAIDLTNPAALNDTLTKLLAANAMVTFADSLKQPGRALPNTPLCTINSGTDYLSGFQFTPWFEQRTLPNGTTINVPGFDHPDVTPNWIFPLVAIVQGVFTFSIAYTLLSRCNFRQK